MAAADIINLPRTKLPFFDITFRNLEDGHYEAPSDYNQVSRQSTSILRDNDALLKAFGTFVLAVSDLEDAAFTAHVGSERLLVTAKAAGINEQLRSFSSDKITISSLPLTSPIADGLLDFELQIIGPESASKVPKQLSSVRINEGCVWPQPERSPSRLYPPFSYAISVLIPPFTLDSGSCRLPY